jgi:SAM-dependent methyltransferase
MNEAGFGPEAWAPLSKAWMAYFRGNTRAILNVHADDGAFEPMPVSVFFRGEGELRGPDRGAVRLARGRTLDVGAGVGAISLVLQEKGLPVTALEVVPEGVEIMRTRGVEDPREGRLEDLTLEEPYDTILLLMNGTALAGTLSGFPDLLDSLGRLLAPGGQVLIDSTDLAGDGEFQYQLEFQGEKGAPFPQLFLEPDTLGGVAAEKGWGMEVVWKGEDGEYLARLSRL